MRGTILPFSPILLGLGLGCASEVRVHFDERADFSRYHTWAWLPDSASRVDAPHANSPALTTRLARLIEEQLGKRGYDRTAEHADFFVSYQLVLRRHEMAIEVPRAPYLFSSYNSSASISVFLPFLARFLGIPLEWAFKVVPPLFLAGIPTITYFIFRKEFGTKVAFLSAFFFVSIPTVLVELSGNARQSIGEFFLVACLWLIVSHAIERKSSRYPLMALFALLTMVSHYTMGGVLWGYLIGSVVLLLAGKYILKLKPHVHIGLLSLVVITTITLGLLYYGWADRGAALSDIKASVSFQINRVLSNEPITVAPPDTPDTSAAGRPTMSVPPASIVGSGGGVGAAHWLLDDPMLALATGGDFFITTLAGKVFRLFQYLTQLLIILGVIVILKNYRKHSPEYLVLVVMGNVILALTLFYPGMSTILNATRFYNLALLFMAPAVIVGGKLLLRNYKVLTIGVLIPYFLFTSGAVFELTKTTDLSKVTIPYTHALSAIRADTAPVLTDNDITARNWIKANNAFPVHGDMGATTAVFSVQSNMGWEVNRLLDKWLISWFVYRPAKDALDPVPDDAYIFLRERNVEKEELTHQIGVGLRWIQSYEDAKFWDLLAGRPIVFRVGNAIVYGPKGQ